MLCISKTPVRISLFGGGTDYPDYFNEHPGAVLGTTINKYIYIVTLPMAGFAQSKYRVTYRIVENVDTVADIQHPVIRAVLVEEGYGEPLNIAIIADMPGGTGLGSSSSFTVGFVNLISRLKGKQITRYELAKEAIRIEHEVLNENVGIQDQLHAAYGGLAKYAFEKKDFTIRPIQIITECRDALNDSLLLVHTGIERRASAVLEEQIEKTKSKSLQKELSHLLALVDQGVAVLERNKPDGMLRELGEMLNETWQTKRALSSKMATDKIDLIYETGIKLGAYGGKLCGAGGGGFFLFIVPQHVQPSFLEAFGHRNVVKIAMEESGARVVGEQ